MKNMLAMALLAGLTMFASLASAQTKSQEDPFTWRWYQTDEQQNLQVNLYVFWRSTCPHCPPALAYVKKMRERYPWLRVLRYEIQHAGNLELYRRMAEKQRQVAGQTPAFFFCNQMMVGYLSDQQTGKRLEANLVRCYEHLQKQIEEKKQKQAPESQTSSDQRRLPGAVAASPRVLALAAVNLVAAGPESEDAPTPDPDDGETSVAGPQADETFPDLEMPTLMEEEETEVVPLLGEVKASEASLPLLTVVIAGCDAFNPCAFFVLLSLLGVLIHAHSRWKMALVGGIFVAFSGLFYFLFMAAWLNVFFLVGHLRIITVTAGVLAVTAAAINMKDFFWFKRGVSLSIPESAKPGLFERMRRLTAAAGLVPMVAGAMALAAAANLYELLCTAGFPMIFTRILSLRDLPTAGYYGYLALYNLIYVIPLAAIVAVVTFTLGRRKLQEREGRVLKLLSGVMMALLGGMLLYDPNLLQSVGVAVGLLVAALALTAAIVLVDRWLRPESPPPSQPKTPNRRERQKTSDNVGAAS